MDEKTEVALKVGEIVKCPLCLETLTDPSTLSCFHNFCTPCTLGLERVRKRRKMGYECPMCRDFTEEKHVKRNNVVLNQLLEIYNQTPLSAVPLKPCSRCNTKKAEWSCAECMKYFCENCRSTHDDFFINQHPVFALQQSAQGQLRCDIHPAQVFRRFCTLCRVAVCRECAADHVGHEIEDINIAIKKIIPQMRSLLTQVKTELTSAESQAEEINNNILESLDSFEKQRNLLKEKQTEERRKFEELQKKEEKCLLEVQDKEWETKKALFTSIKDKIAELKSVVQLTEDTLEQSNDFSQLVTFESGLRDNYIARLSKLEQDPASAKARSAIILNWLIEDAPYSSESELPSDEGVELTPEILSPRASNNIAQIIPEQVELEADESHEQIEYELALELLNLSANVSQRECESPRGHKNSSFSSADVSQSNCESPSSDGDLSSSSAGVMQREFESPSGSGDASATCNFNNVLYDFPIIGGAVGSGSKFKYQHSISIRQRPAILGMQRFEMIDGKMWVPSYEEPRIRIYSLDGKMEKCIDLTSPIKDVFQVTKSGENQVVFSSTAGLYVYDLSPNSQKLDLLANGPFRNICVSGNRLYACPAETNVVTVFHSGPNWQYFSTIPLHTKYHIGSIFVDDDGLYIAHWKFSAVLQFNLQGQYKQRFYFPFIWTMGKWGCGLEICGGDREGNLLICSEMGRFVATVNVNSREWKYFHFANVCGRDNPVDACFENESTLWLLRGDKRNELTKFVIQK